MSMELLKHMAGIDLQHIPFKGTGPAMTEVLSGRIAALFSNMLTAKPLIEAGKLRALAVSGPKRVAALPDVPTVAEAGVPGYSALQWYGLLAPAGTPQPIIDKLQAAVAEALRAARCARAAGAGRRRAGRQRLRGIRRPDQDRPGEMVGHRASRQHPGRGVSNPMFRPSSVRLPLCYCLAASAQAQPAWPTKPVKILVPTAPGGTADATARMFALHLGKVAGPAVLRREPRRRGQHARHRFRGALAGRRLHAAARRRHDHHQSSRLQEAAV